MCFDAQLAHTFSMKIWGENPFSKITEIKIEIPNHFYNASFVFNTYERLLYGILILKYM